MPVLSLHNPTDFQRIPYEMNVIKEFVNELMHVPPPEYLAAVAFYMSTQVEIIAETTYTVVPEDHNKIKDFTNSSGITVTVPAGLNSNILGVPFTCGLSKGGTGSVTVVADAGATVNAPNGTFIMGVRYGLMTLTEWPDGSFRLYGAGV